MAKNNKERYKQENEAFLAQLQDKEGVQELRKGLLYEVLRSGAGRRATSRSLVSVYYRGELINGKVFDDNHAQGYPDAFRLSGLIEGWQIAIPYMSEGDQWRIYVPSELGYGKRGVHGIPGDSTLIFEIELVKVQ
ncbi:MAG: FKBP-type peptidyl-prolyl cis-trans isomerase [Bacteroidaceae bacterium]|nr:FKBP-type peptidyl-prolyl cis-trans isomerase [Bacteroidaceae bacterium]